MKYQKLVRVLVSDIMSFQRIANDDYLSFEDASLVYVRDKHGVLTSPPGYEKSKEISKLTESDTVYGSYLIIYFIDIKSEREIFLHVNNFNGECSII